MSVRRPTVRDALNESPGAECCLIFHLFDWMDDAHLAKVVEDAQQPESGHGRNIGRKRPLITCLASATICRTTSPAGRTESIRPASWPIRITA
jgi:hypothetical protein